MTITQSELDQLKEAVHRNSVNDLIEKWGAEIFLRESKKDGNITFTLPNLKKTEERQVTGQRIANSFCFHKDVWGGSFWVLTHVPSGIKTLSGKKITVAKVLKDFAAWEYIEALDLAMTKHGMDALKHVESNIVQEYRKFYEDARY